MFSFNFFSTWVISLFILWYIGYIFHIKSIIDYINPYYSLIIICIGYILYINYLQTINYKFTPKYFIINTLSHFIPLIISYKYVSNKHGFINMIIIIMVYIMYMIIINETPQNVYLNIKK